MDQQLVNQLCNAYPELLGRQFDDGSTQCVGLDCGNGWFKILWDLCDAIIAHCQRRRIPVPQAVQVKEKMGGLRVYISPFDREIGGLITEAEKRSMETCERCGADGTLACNQGVWRVRCPDCEATAR